MLTDFAPALGTVATVYSLAAGGALLLQVRTMIQRGSSCDVSMGYLATTAGGYATWLLYGMSIDSVPLVVSDAIGLLFSSVALVVAQGLRAGCLSAAR